MVSAFFYQLEGAAAIVCVVIIFGCYRNVSKPAFVWVMWAFLTVAAVTNIAETISIQARYVKEDDTEEQELLFAYYNETWSIYFTTFNSGHWVFAIKYLEVVLNLPLLVFP